MNENNKKIIAKLIIKITKEKINDAIEEMKYKKIFINKIIESSFWNLKISKEMIKEKELTELRITWLNSLKIYIKLNDDKMNSILLELIRKIIKKSKDLNIEIHYSKFFYFEMIKLGNE